MVASAHAVVQPRWQPGDRGQLAVVVASHAVQHLYAGALAFSYPFVVVAFHVSYAKLGLVLGLVGVIGGLLQGAAGLARDVPARVLLGVQNLGLAAMAVLAAIAPSFAVFAGARCGGALIQWPQHPVGSALLTDRFPRRRGFVLSWHTTGGSIGTLLVPVAAGFVTERFGWRWGLGMFAIPLALGGLLVALRLREPHEDEPAADRPAAEGGGRRELWQLLRGRTVLLVLAAGTVAAGGRGLGVLTAWVPAYLRSGLHFTPFAVGLLFAAVLIGSVAGPLFVGRASDRRSRRGVLVATYLVGAAALVGYVYVGAVPALLAIVGLLVGIFAYAESPLLQSLFSDVTGSAQARAAFGVYFAISYGVGALWQVAIGAIVTDVGFRAAFGTMAGSFCVAALLIALARPHRAAAPIG